MKFRFSYFILLFFISSVAFAQQISVDNSIPLQTLIENHLANDCIEISNVTSSVNGNSIGIGSYGSFDVSGSNFPIDHGIVLSTGNANSAGNTLITTDLKDGSNVWGTDPDIETALGINNTLNATSIEFDFISIAGQVQFDYIFASEEYKGYNPCQISDGVAILIKPNGSAGPYQNMAIIPNTSTPITTNTIHDEIFGVCTAQNEAYFDGYNMGDTNFNGRTNILTATANTTPYVQYHVKIIIADQSFFDLDSAVFIGASNFTNLDLGDDVSTCAGALTLDGEIENSLATYQWFLNNSPISGETNPSLEADQSGLYKLEITIPINNTTCIIADEVNVTINSEQNAYPISNYELCDQDENGFEVFDLSLMDTQVIASVPSGNYAISYHNNDTDARNNNNPINAPMANNINPQPIYVRIDDLSTNCLAYATFDLIVNTTPSITQPTSLDACEDEINDGYTNFDLTSKDNEIISGQNNLSVSYHLTLVDANNSANAIASPYRNLNSPNDQVYVRVTNTQTGCYSTTILDLTIIESPIINREPVYIDACDLDHDGFATFDLNQVVPGILQGLTNVSTSFHLTLADAESGSNPIANNSNFQNTSPNEQTLFLRVEDNANGCPAIIPIEIHTNLLLTATEIQDFALCDDESNDGIEDFSLSAIANAISNGIPGITISFYETLVDLSNGNNAINTTNLYAATSPQILYIKLESSICEEQAEITLFVNPVLVFQPVDPIDYCDTDDDGYTTIDLKSFDDIVTNNNPNFSVRYFGSKSDAETGINQHPHFYTNISNPETIFARIENTDTGCFTVNSFDINVINAPTVSQPNNEIICDSDQDGFTIINLESKIPDMVTDTTGLNINFFTSNDDAINNVNPITNTTSYNANSQTIFTRVESLLSSCFAIVSFDIIVNTLPVFSIIDSYQICENDGDNIADFLLNEKDEEILNGHTEKFVSYYETMNNAENGLNPIDKNVLYQNTSSPQTIFVRVENMTDANCYGISSFTIQVAPNPIYNSPSSYLICDDISNDGVVEFDFNEKISEISQGSPTPMNISFHTSLLDAENNTNQQPLLFTNTENPQQIYVRIENSDSSCFLIEDFGINIIPAPGVTLAQPMIQCDSNYDGILTFDLTSADYEILDIRQTDLVINYFETLEDLELDTNPINNATNYTNLTNPQTVYIKVENTVSMCYSAIPLELIVNLPPAINALGTIEICDNDSNTFDLSTIDPLIVNDPSLVNISYHISQNDASNNINTIGSTFTYSSISQYIYARVSYLTTGCLIVTSFILQINENPIANTPLDLIACDDDYDGLLTIDLQRQDAQIIGNQNPNNFEVSYYQTIEDANNKVGKIDPIYLAFDDEIIFSRIENINTGCYNITEFSIIINELPVIVIADVLPICRKNLPLYVNAETGIATDTYLWSTGETTSEIALGLEDVGNYWVTVTNSNGCEAIKSFSAIESDEATIEFTTTVDFADPNSITVDVSGIGDYVYILDNGLPQTSNVFNNVTLGLHLVTIRDLNGCNDVSKEVVVIDAPKFMTPNNDGYFDTWHIVGIERLPGTLVYIYDRYGKLLKTLLSSSPGWNGKFNGANMPSDDYWFVAKVKKDAIEFDVKGHFALKR